MSGLFGNFNPLNKETATLEELLMLLGSFVLGYLVHKIIHRCRTTQSTTTKIITSGASSSASVSRATKSKSKKKKSSSTSTAKTNSSTSTTTSAAAKMASPAKRDDLKVIEGIGPKLEEILNSNGIMSFEQLAATPVATIQKILDKLGQRYQMHDPSSWGLQAGLAAQKRWSELNKLQEKLKSGRMA